MVWSKTKDSRIRKRGEFYYARFSRKGVRIETSLNTKNFENAKSIVGDIELALLKNENWKSVLRPDIETGLPLIGEKWELFVEDKAKGNVKKKIKKVRENTLIQYVNFWERYFKPFWELKTFSEITEDTWDEYIKFAQGKSERKDELVMFNHVKYFKAFCTWAVKYDFLIKVPNLFDPIDALHEDEIEDLEADGVGRNYSDEELLRFREFAKSHKQFYLYILMLQYMGMRSTEVTHLQKKRIDLSKRVINLKGSDTKTKKKRVIPIHDVVFDLLVEQVNSSESPYLYPNKRDIERPMDSTGFKKLWNAAREETGISGRIHDFRHSYATRAFANPKTNPIVLCEALGMSLEVARKIYIHLDDTHVAEIAKNFQLGGE